MHLQFTFSFLVVVFVSFTFAELDSRRVRCLVCQTALKEMETKVQNLDPRKVVPVGSYRLDGNGNLKQESVPTSKSEVHLVEIAEEVCSKIDDFVRATRKDTGELILLKLVDEFGKMNSDMSNVDIIQDGDLNKSLKYYCDDIMDEYEESIINHYRNGSKDIDIRVCSLEAELCDESLEDDVEEISYRHEDEL